jgi:hypothetical protein
MRSLLTAAVGLSPWLAFGQGPASGVLRPNEFEVIRSMGAVTIKAEPGAEMEPAKVGQTYQMGKISKVDPADWTKDTGEAAQKLTEFKVVAASGEVLVRPGNHGVGAEPAEIGKSYEMGSKMWTGRNAYADIEFSPRNVCRLLANAEVVIGPKTKSPKLTTLKLHGGAVDAKLDSFPRGQYFDIETPMGVCGAVGTSYKVAYDVNQQGAMTHSVEVFNGQVGMFGTFLKIIGKPLQPGQRLIAEIIQQDEDRIVTVKFLGQPGDELLISIWGRVFLLRIEPDSVGDVDGQAVAMAQISLRMTARAPWPPPWGREWPGDQEFPFPVIPPIKDRPSSPAGT